MAEETMELYVILCLSPMLVFWVLGSILVWKLLELGNCQAIELG